MLVDLFGPPEDPGALPPASDYLPSTYAVRNTIRNAVRSTNGAADRADRGGNRAAAIEVLDEAGVVGLSMRRVADRLGTGVASLYAHGDLRSILIAHRDAALAGLGRIPTSPRTLVAAETLVAVLRAGGLSDRVIALGFDQLTLYVAAEAFESGLLEQCGMSPEEIQQYLDDVNAFYMRLPPDRFPVLASIAEDLAAPDAEARFEFGLDVLIAGLESMSAGTV
jgi:AcrR family transcriptional regulator